jgi:MarR family transcriptional regulator, transcriptional regulator for hemolysin
VSKVRNPGNIRRVTGSNRAEPAQTSQEVERAEGEAPHQSPSHNVPLLDSRMRAVGIKLSVIARQLANRFDHAVERDGLSRAKWGVIVAVARMPGATQRSIASMLEITEVTAGQLIDRLSADGYIERREHPKDRRAYCVHLTDKAQPLLVRLGEIAKSHEVETFAGLNDEDLTRLDALLDVIARNLAACRSGDKKGPAIADEDR